MLGQPPAGEAPIYIGRADLPNGRWGNYAAAPMEHTEQGHAAAVEAYWEWLMGEPGLIDAARKPVAAGGLRGGYLRCPCAPRGHPCHGDVLVAVANMADAELAAAIEATLV